MAHFVAYYFMETRQESVIPREKKKLNLNKRTAEGCH